MIGEFDKATNAPAEIEKPKSSYVAVNRTHYCGDFESITKARQHIRMCEALRAKSLCYVRGEGACRVCLSSEVVKMLPKIRSPYARITSQPFGSMDRRSDSKVRVVVLL